MTSTVSVCNRALSKIGDELIVSSLDDETKTARYCKALFNDTRDFVLRSYPWRFALKRYVLAPLKEKPLFGFSAAFAVPSDCLRVWKTVDCGGYQTEGGNILADGDAFRFIGISRVEDAERFDPMFVEALALRLAADLAVPLAASTALKDALCREYRDFVQQAKTASAMEGAQDVCRPAGWLEARAS